MVDVYVPRFDPSLETVTIVEWKKEVNDDIKKDEVIAILLGEKVQFEVKSPCDGKLIKLNFRKGEEAPVGSVLAVIDCKS
ncbi:MAG: biotin/lipoyl-containing protein [Nitrososphaeria archaeon]